RVADAHETAVVGGSGCAHGVEDRERVEGARHPHLGRETELVGIALVDRVLAGADAVEVARGGVAPGGGCGGSRYARLRRAPRPTGEGRLRRAPRPTGEGRLRRAPRPTGRGSREHAVAPGGELAVP